MMKNALLLVLALAFGTSALAADFKVVVNNANDLSRIKKKELSLVFMKKTPKWEDGTVIAPVDQQEKTAVREAFTTTVHGKSVSAVKSYWQQQIFSGREVPPVEKPSDAAVIAFVKANAGAIGYVSAGADTAGVKVVDVQ